MMKKNIFKCFIVLFCLSISFAEFASAKDISVVVVPTEKITTANSNLQEGDDISFVVANDVFVGNKLYVKKGEKVTGLITKLVSNDYTCDEASIYAENFKVKSASGNEVKLEGIVYKKGRNHALFAQFIPADITSWFVLIRGGEAQIRPGKDSFILYVEGQKSEDL